MHRMTTLSGTAHFRQPALIVFSGLPGVGKTTIAKILCRKIRACYLRIDTVEQTLRCQRPDHPVTCEGYEVAYSIAQENLALGCDVIADSVNPIELTRDAWRQVAVRSEALCLEVEIICSHMPTHRQRVEGRKADISGMTLPTWQKVIDRNYTLWHRPRLVIDTASNTAEEAAEQIRQNIRR